MTEKRQIVIAEDQTILREGLRALLEKSDDLEVVGEAEDGFGAIKCVEESVPDLILLDIAMPKMNGIAAIRDIKRQSPETKILVLTVHKYEEYVLEVFQAGADGYCLKDANHAELLTAIRGVLSGKRYISPGIADKVLEGYLEGKKPLKTGSSWETVTHREREVLKLIGEGYKNKEIADYLCISVKTVEKHRANIMKKLDLHNSSALTKLAIDKGLVTK
ncbi:MAG: DNA-binding response regulator [Candidatus Abyssobacteria bacterium SURF_5]|uniref:DNA-binding response regulator n=1 Tax=Abyssobacteria bacterium (strain SURF_5) TaxID=2093360 RepID=A0A3A4NQC9_ABYX5|nr:MAG: DNA-binding response regulator [Candidatus Abyssubacteria bacterium SURF_5]